MEVSGGRERYVDGFRYERRPRCECYSTGAYRGVVSPPVDVDIWNEALARIVPQVTTVAGNWIHHDAASRGAADEDSLAVMYKCHD
jgi:hypothetical protein